MTVIPPPNFWIEQARADFGAAGAQGSSIKACHRRYWLQQAYEKAIKAFLVSHLSDESKEVMLIVRDTVLRSHSPLLDFPDEEMFKEIKKNLRRDYPEHWQRGARAIRLLSRQGRAFIYNRSQAHAVILKKIDATKPSIAATTPSYRYPFFVNQKAVSPSTWSGWDTYQGKEADVMAAVQELINAVANEIATTWQRNRVR